METGFVKRQNDTDEEEGNDINELDLDGGDEEIGVQEVEEADKAVRGRNKAGYHKEQQVARNECKEEEEDRPSKEKKKAKPKFQEEDGAPAGLSSGKVRDRVKTGFV